MKKSILLFLFISLIIGFSNFSNESIKSFILTEMGEDPDLPDDSYIYNEVEFPSHLKASTRDTIIDTGYESTPIDTATFTMLNNDIVTLGRVLFYDEKLSALENISCASCHQQEKSFADNLALSEGINMPTRRNSMQLNDIGWTNREHFFWDMSHTNLHEMIVLPLTDENEVGANMLDVQTKLLETSYYPDLFTKAYGDTSIDETKIVDALVQFVSSMNTFNSKFDVASENNFASFTELEVRGLELFGEHCGTCHSQGRHDPFGFGIGSDEFFFEEISSLEMFPEIFNNGLESDQSDLGAGEWNEGFSNLFKIPTLRNIAVTGPYMHDGRFNSLEEVLDHYSDEIVESEWSGIIPPDGFNFDAGQKTSIIAFLNTLTDDSFLTDPKWSNPFGSTSSIPDALDFNIVIKPNPMMEYAVIEFENPSNELMTINVLSSTGQLIKSNKVSSQSFELNKNDFSSGVYFIQISKGDIQSMQKLIVN